MESDVHSDTTRQDRLRDIPKFESMTVNPGLVPEGLAFWRRWRKSDPA